MLLRRPPGREAYPGDVFYPALASASSVRREALGREGRRFADRAADHRDAGRRRLAAYIPTNVISITDGQIFLSTDLFFKGIRPAVNVGISVSRVGGSAQIKAMRSVAGPLKLDLAQFRELEAFAKLGSDLDKNTQAQLNRGEKITEILKQPQYKPQLVEEQVLLIFAATKGYLTNVPTPRLAEWSERFIARVREKNPEIPKSIVDSSALSDETAKKLVAAIEEFNKSFS